MDFGPYNMLTDFALMSILLFIGQLLRSKVKLIQNFYLPASLLAGLMGLFLGPQFLDIIPFSKSIGSYPYLLVVVLFASLFIGNNEKQSFKKTIDSVGDTFALNLSAESCAYGISCIVGGIIIIMFFPEVHEGFALLMPAGFSGGHSASAAIGGIFNEILGWEDATTIGQTFATIGLLVGMFVGITLINVATRMKATRFVESIGDLPEEMKTGLIPYEKQIPTGRSTTSSMSIESFTWHFALVLIASAIGYYGTNFLNGIVPKISFPMVCIAMIGGVILQSTLNLIKYDQYVDKQIITKIGSSVTDYLVGFGIASIKISVVKANLSLIVILCILGTLYGIFFVFVIGKRLFKNFWFERSIFIFGWSTGVVATGVTLLRIVDPEFKSKTLEDYGMAYVFISLYELVQFTVMPVFVANGYIFHTGAVLILLSVALWIFCAKKYGINNEPVDQLREGEAEVIGIK